ncbi:elongation of very long chain fatty acids protein 4-like [Leptopilina boulardi]|uniref:elongation of very long chain fatty acids protein 4-like n=1 Tax=Leptopilina boulardi TaxID=63433 RepID=UPI0021F5E9B5|nr:elongation of very long chain fatty acids protein 4-like [Leptopilina boulardi]
MSVMETVNYYYYDLADPRIRDWFLLNSIWYPIIIILAYIVIAFKLAPAYMKNRPAYKLNTFIKCYNLFQVILNAYIVKELVPCYSFLRFFECRPIEYTIDACGLTIMKCGYLTIALKIIDLIETVIYILRKKNNQVSILHVYHHITTCLIAIIFTRYFCGEVAILVPIMNCGVHVIMYSYYFLSNFEGPIKQIIMPFKRYLTIAQMIQFSIMIVQIIAGLLQNCELSKVLLFIMLINVAFIFYLFFRFYKKTYIIKSKKEKCFKK